MTDKINCTADSRKESACVFSTNETRDSLLNFARPLALPHARAPVIDGNVKGTDFDPLIFLACRNASIHLFHGTRAVCTAQIFPV
jgi:hypothetical protein